MTPQQETFDPCKFCDSTDINEVSGTDQYMFAECQHCGATGPTERVRSTMIAAWNRRAPAPTEPAVDRDAVLGEAADICAAIMQDHWLQYKGRGKWAKQENPRQADPRADGCSDGASQCEDAIRALIATPASPAVPGEMRLTEQQMRAIAKVIAGRVAKNASVAPELCFAPALFALQESFGPAAVQALPAPAPLAPSEEECTLCNGMGFIDGAGATCPHCDGNGIEKTSQASQPTSAEELQQKEHIPPSRAEPASHHDVSKLGNLRFQMMDAYDFGEKRHPQEFMRATGINYDHATPQSIGDQWWFWNCENVPYPLPDFLSVMTVSPHEAIGYGLSREIADKLASRCRAQGGITNDSKGLPTSAEGKDSERLDKMIDWYLRDGKRMEIDPWGHVSQTTKAHILHWLDGGSNADPEERASTGKDTDKEATK